MAYSQSWLEDNTVRRCILVVVGVYDVVAASETFKYIATTGFTTSDSAVSFLPIITGGLKFNENITFDGGLSVSYGDVGINNPNGEYDIWLDNTKYVWTNRTIQVYYGDPSWVCANEAQIYTDFEMVFNGIVADIDSKDRLTLNIKVRDKFERLNNPLTENKLGVYGTWSGGQTNQDAIKPVIFGEPFNVEPLLVDPATLQYMFNDGVSEGITEIRDNGVPLYTSGVLTTGAVVDNANGKFVLTAPLVGTCTISAQGVNKSINLTTGALQLATYSNTVPNLIALITTQYGNPVAGVKLNGPTELDLANFTAFAVSNGQAVGFMVSDRTNVLTICQDLADSIGAQLYFTRKGKLQLLKIGVPTGDAIVNITDSDIVFGSLSITNRTEVIASKKIGYARNYTVQANLTTSIPSQNKDLFANEWLSTTSADSTNVKTLYKLSLDPVQKDTLLIVKSDADTEAIRLNNYFGSTKTTYSFTARAKLLSLKLGQSVFLTHRRFGLSSGKTGQVISLSPDWSTGLIDVGVII